MKNKSNHYYIREFDTVDIATQYKTPLFIVDLKKIRKNYLAYEESIKKNYSNFMVCYAYKANTLLKICNTLRDLGAGAEVVSEGEFFVSQKVGLSPKKIVFNGVNKTENEILKSAESNIYMLIADSLDEIDFTENILKENGKKLNYGIRVNPEVETKTHKFISTGERDTKFGVGYEEATQAFELAAEKENLNLRGIHFHVGSQIESLTPFSDALDKIIELYFKIEDLGIKLDTIDVGGGLAVPINNNNVPSIAEYTSLITKKVKDAAINVKLVFEPGRRLINDSNVALLTVGTVKKNWIMVDGGANLFLRAAYLDWYHGIEVANKLTAPVYKNYNIAGPLCFSGDIIAKNRSLPKVTRGDLILVKDCGAYTLSMADNFNYKLRPKVISIDDEVEVIKEEEDFEHLTRHEVNWDV